MMTTVIVDGHLVETNREEAGVKMQMRVLTIPRMTVQLSTSLLIHSLDKT